MKQGKLNLGVLMGIQGLMFRVLLGFKFRAGVLKKHWEKYSLAVHNLCHNNHQNYYLLRDSKEV